VDRILLSPSTYLTASPDATSTTSTTTTTSSSTTTSPSGSTLRVLHWNIHHGVGTDGVYDLDRIATWIVKTKPEVVSLNEVERFTSWGNEDQPKRFADLLKAKTGKTWYYHFASRSGADKAQGNLWLSLYPIEATGSLLLSHNRSVAQIRITVNGRTVNLFSTHLDADSSSRRATQMEELKKWAAGFPEQRIVAGDFNTWPSAGEIARMTGTHFDVWAEAAKAGTAVAYPGNTNGATRNNRIDYLFLSHGATRTTIKGAQVFDVRDANGVQPSDHRPLLGIFEVK
jgi:endonuclease/exonuclease/phosphatase family metal-dependent hydrolase